jgi:beta-glucanase (GH16 family)
VGGGKDTVPFQDWSGADGFRFWFKGTNSGVVFKIILTDNAGERLSTRFTDNSADWQLLSFPWQVFGHDDGYQPGGAPNDGPTLTAVEAFAFAPQGNGSGSFYLDQIELYRNTASVIDNFQSGLTSWFQYGDTGSSWAQSLVVTNTLSTLGVVSNTVSLVNYVSAGWGVGGGKDTVPFQDWSGADGFRFWFKGTNSGVVFKIILTDNAGERLSTRFTDNSADWQLLSFPWQVFGHDDGYQPGGAPNDGPTLTAVEAFAFAPQGTGSGSFYLDQIGLYGSASSTVLPKAGFPNQTYNVSEGSNAQVPVQLNATSATTVTVDYETVGGTATVDVDYTPVSGTLIFAPGATIMTATVPITDDAAYELAETIVLSLTGASGATIGLYNPTTINLVDNDAPPNVLLIDNFESGLTTGTDIFNNKLGYSTWGSTQGNVAITVTSGMTYTGGTLPNTVLKMTSNIESWGGFTNAFKDGDSWGHQDWSRYDGLRFWFYGTGSGKQIQIEIFDNRQLENLGDSAERYYQRFTEDFSGWKQISLPFAFFQRRTDYQPGGAPADGLNLTEVSGFAFNMPSVTSETIYYVDQVELYGDLSAHPATTRVNLAAYGFGVIEGQTINARVVLNSAAATTVTVTYVITADTATAGLDFTGPLSGSLVFAPGETAKTISVPTVDDGKPEAREQMKLALTGSTGAPISYVSRGLLVIIDNDTPDPRMIDDFENGVPTALKPFGAVTVITQTVLATDPLAVPGQDPDNSILHVTYTLPAGFTGGFDRMFDAPTDLSQSEALSFWYYGSGSGKSITVTLLDNGQPDPGPGGWTDIAWSDEFSGTAGAAPNPANWRYDLGGGGWGNNEWQYYTDSRDNSALDGSGNLVITALTNTNPANICTAASPTGPGGPCYATSARLLTAGKQEFTYGRMEARLQIPRGQGIWPAFWMLGNDIFTTNPWPASGEIDIMENIGKPSEQSKVYGTIHGPGYSGGSGIGGSHNVSPTILADDFHVYAVEWEPTRIRWYLDGYNYFTATQAMLPPGADWVFDHPFFFILNVAVGGNWPGYPDATTVLPQMMKVDYVRVYQAPDTAERFEAAFVDDTVGWKKITLPFSAFTRSAAQPAGAPNDGLTLTAAQGYRFDLAGSDAAPSGEFYLDNVKHVDVFNVYLPLIRR